LNWRDNTNAAERSYYSDLMHIMQEFFLGEEGILSANPTVRQIGRVEFIDAWAKQAAKRMVVGRAVANARTWRMAAREAMQGPRIHRALQQELSGPVGARVRELIERNAKLIKTFPREVAAVVAQRAAAQYAGGGRSSELSRYDTILARAVRFRARLVARTEVSKASTALTQARSEELQLEWFIWRTSDDQRVRLAHRKMAGVLFQWSHLPSPEALVGEKSYGRYAPGNIFNCRCYPEVLLSLTQVAWPHRVFWNGVIRSMTLAQFRSINNLSVGERLGLAA
jgi:SPP1 gp7 family putative phage head morphogenesis protein